MRPDWRECPRDEVTGQWAALYITMNPKGKIAMSRVTYERLGTPAAFLLLYDATNNRIGLKPTGAGIRNAYPVRVWGKRGGKVIRAYRLMHEFGIHLPETLRFHDAEVDNDGILILDMRTARVSVRGAGKKRQKRDM